MKKSILIGMLIIWLLEAATSQTLTLLKPGQVYKSSTGKDMVVLELFDFGALHYTANKYDSLKNEVTDLDRLLMQRDSAENALVLNYEKLLQQKTTQALSYENSFQRLNLATQNCIEENKALTVSYQKIEQKNKRLKTWRNWFMGTSAVLSAAIIFYILR